MIKIILRSACPDGYFLVPDHDNGQTPLKIIKRFGPLIVLQDPDRGYSVTHVKTGGKVSRWLTARKAALEAAKIWSQWDWQPWDGAILHVDDKGRCTIENDAPQAIREARWKALVESGRYL